jgi:hypothetical protein
MLKRDYQVVIFKLVTKRLPHPVEPGASCIVVIFKLVTKRPFLED